MANYKPKKIIELPKINIHRSARGRYNAMAIDASDGSIKKETGWKPNLILDSGLKKIAYMPWAQVFQFCVAGKGAGTSAPNQTDVGLVDPVMMNSFYLEGPANCGFKIYKDGDDAYLKLFRTFDFLKQYEDITINELGFKETPGAQELFSRITMTGGTNSAEAIDILAGQFLRVRYELNIKLTPSPYVPNAFTSTDNGFNVSGNHSIQLVGMGGIDSYGRVTPVDGGGFCNEPFSYGSVDFGPSWGFVNRWQNGDGIQRETKTKTVIVRDTYASSVNNADVKKIKIDPATDYFYVNETIAFSSRQFLLVSEVSRGDTEISGILTGGNLSSGSTGTCTEIIGYKQPDYGGGERLSDVPGPFRSLYNYQDFNKFLNEDCIKNKKATDASGVEFDLLVYRPESLYLEPNIDEDGNDSNYTPAVPDVDSGGPKGYWPWGNFVPLKMYTNFARLYGLSVSVTDSTRSYTGWRSTFVNLSDSTYDNFYESPSFTSSPLSYVMRPVSLYDPEGMGASSSANYGGGIYTSHYFHLQKHFYDPNQNSSVGSYLTETENIVTQPNPYVGQKTIGRFWQPWYVRGASCFLSNNNEEIAVWDSERPRGKAFDRTALVKSLTLSEDYSPSDNQQKININSSEFNFSVGESVYAVRALTIPDGGTYSPSETVITVTVNTQHNFYEGEQIVFQNGAVFTLSEDTISVGEQITTATIRGVLSSYSLNGGDKAEVYSSLTVQEAVEKGDLEVVAVLNGISKSEMTFSDTFVGQADFYELPLRLGDFTQGLNSYKRTKFCFFDNSVANTVIKGSSADNDTQIKNPWTMLGVGGTTDWSINPATMNGAAIDNGYVVKFTDAQNKDDENVLKVIFEYTWNRQ